MATPALNPLVEKIRATHPGAYDDMDDAELTKRVLAKYPQYSDLAAPPMPHTSRHDVVPDPIRDQINSDKTAGLAGVPGGAPHVQPAPDAALGVAGLGLGAGAALTYGPAILPFAKTVGKALPYIAASEGINYARHHVPGGKLIPPGAELLPFFMGGGKPEAAEAEEATAAERTARPTAIGPHAESINADPRLDRIVRKVERPNGPIHGSGARMASPAAEPDVDLTTRRPPAPTETPKIASPEASTSKRAIDMSETELAQQYKRQGIQSKSFEQADELARGRAENKAVMEHPGEESIPSQHSQPKIASPAQPSLTRNASGAPEAVWPKEYKQPTNGGGGNYTADDLSKLKQKHGIASPDEDLTPQLQASLDKVKTKAKIESIGDQVESSLGGKKLAPDVPLRNQIASPAPNGHTAVESSALKSYKYDPNAKEFHAQFKSGDDIHVFGDVSPEEAQAFEGADSKGKAIQSIKRNPLVAKIVNGKRVSVKPGVRMASPEGRQ